MSEGAPMSRSKRYATGAVIVSALLGPVIFLMAIGAVIGVAVWG